MITWPLLQRNKVEDSKINIPVQRYAETAEDEKMKGLAQKVCNPPLIRPFYSQNFTSS